MPHMALDMICINLKRFFKAQNDDTKDNLVAHYVTNSSPMINNGSLLSTVVIKEYSDTTLAIPPF